MSRLGSNTGEKSHKTYSKMERRQKKKLQNTEKSENRVI